MKQLFLCLLSLALAAGPLTSCNEEAVPIDYEDPNYGNEEEQPSPAKPAEILLTSDVVAISAVAGKIKNVVLVSNQSEFSISPADASWYSTQFVGKALIITPKTTNNELVNRTADVTITAGVGDNTATFPLRIKQNTMLEEPAEVSVAQSEFTVSGKQGEVTNIPLVSNKLAFTISPAETSWYTTSFTGTTLVVTSIEANTSGSIRRQEVTVTAGVAPNSATVTFTLAQALKPELDPMMGRVIDGGVVFWVSRSTGKYKAVALVDNNPNFTVYWQASNTTRVTTGATNTTDGRINVLTYKAQSNYATAYTAIRLCDEKTPAGSWYLPANAELNALYDGIEEYGRELFNGIVGSNGGTLFEYAGKTYWSSTESSDVNAYCLRFSDNKWLTQSKTSAARHIRCITERDIP